ncbi:hypothetical protein L1049_016763 [Liquidambar formosana]|uniref:FCP1 homology domain-containing protein n=1 Tax=Liquidambar formosana TaxID=63359 RepID=A0AAP0S0F1_LIQFO
MKSLNEIGGTSVSDLFTILPAEANSNPADNLMAEDIPINEDLNLGTIVDCDIGKGSMTWPFYEVNNVGQDTYQDIGMINEALLNPDDALFSYSIQQTSLSNHDVDIFGYLGAANEEDCYPWSPYWAVPLQRELQNRLPITLVLDLDETLVHSSFDNCNDADFTFSIHSKMQVQTVFVRQRPYLQLFLQAVAGMFDIVIFTAGQSTYAGQLLDILDPNQTLIGQRVYRDSCVFSDGGYVKDLTILGRDLARIAIVDNTPQVFQLQVENGIPIESWFGDRSDDALLSLLLFLETLVGADDVRPIIKNKFGYQEQPHSFDASD